MWASFLFFGNITCCCDLEISVHIFILCVLWFSYFSLFFRHHPHPRSISKLLTKVSVLIIKMCLDFFMASSICFFFCCCYQNLCVGFCVSGELKDCKLNEWAVNGFIEIDDSKRYKHAVDLKHISLSSSAHNWIFYIGVLCSLQQILKKTFPKVHNTHLVTRSHLAFMWNAYFSTTMKYEWCKKRKQPKKLKKISGCKLTVDKNLFLVRGSQNLGRRN